MNQLKSLKDRVRIIKADARTLASRIEPKSVQCCVTSPPYYQLRDYRHDSQIGQEKTVQQFVDELVTVFMQVHTVLKDDGVCWINIGDTYAGKKQGTDKVGDMHGVPWRLAFALKDAGWYLRQDIIWHKPSCAPESAPDRCTRNHEYIFMMTKSRDYYFDQEAIKVKAVTAGSKFSSARIAMRQNDAMGFKFPPTEKQKVVRTVADTKIKRSVWSVNPGGGVNNVEDTEHFASYPKKLIEPCILATSKEGDWVLDPFMGSGTTAEVALFHGRKAVGCEINDDYIMIIGKRLKNMPQPVEHRSIFSGHKIRTQLR